MSSRGIRRGSGGGLSNSKEFVPTGTGPTRQESSSWSSSSLSGDETKRRRHSRSGEESGFVLRKPTGREGGLTVFQGCHAFKEDAKTVWFRETRGVVEELDILWGG